jgi:hypothetical protein
LGTAIQRLSPILHILSTFTTEIAGGLISVQAQDPDNPSGIQAWLLILASIAFMMLGVLTGIVVEKKLLRK